MRAVAISAARRTPSCAFPACLMGATRLIANAVVQTKCSLSSAPPSSPSFSPPSPPAAPSSPAQQKQQCNPPPSHNPPIPQPHLGREPHPSLQRQLPRDLHRSLPRCPGSQPLRRLRQTPLHFPVRAERVGDREVRADVFAVDVGHFSTEMYKATKHSWSVWSVDVSAVATQRTATPK